MNSQALAPRPGRGEQRPSNPNRLAHDHALYTCVCGYVFEAPVSTSVDCPHCGETQAW
jgi:rubrerythrin